MVTNEYHALPYKPACSVAMLYVAVPNLFAFAWPDLVRRSVTEHSALVCPLTGVLTYYRVLEYSLRCGPTSCAGPSLSTQQLSAH